MNNSKLSLYGLYSLSGENSIKGVCNIFIDTDGFVITNENVEELPSQVYNDLFAYKKLDKVKGEELFNLKTDHILLDSIDNVYLVAEQFYITYVNNRKVENYGGLLIIKLNSKGKIEWGRSVDKYDYRPNYNVFIKDDLLHLVLNSGKNLKEFDDGRIVLSQGAFETSALYDFAYDKSGKFEINKIQNNKGKTYYLPSIGSYVNEKFIMIGNSSKNRRFMVLK